jgi:very-short-patch-repair endonuclease
MRRESIAIRRFPEVLQPYPPPFYTRRRMQLAETAPKVSEAEKKLARSMIKAKIPFKSQVPIATKKGMFVVDFLVGSRCVVECEGVVHQATLAADDSREANLEARGYKVLRFPNFQVFSDVTYVLHTIRSAMESNPDTEETTITHESLSEKRSND